MSTACTSWLTPSSKPKICSTLQVKLGDVQSLHDKSWDPPDTSECSVLGLDPQELFRRWIVSECSVLPVDPEEIFHRWIALNELFGVDYKDRGLGDWDARDVLCAMDLPEGGTKLVVHRRPVPWKSPDVFLFSDCYFLLASVLESEDAEVSCGMRPFGTRDCSEIVSISMRVSEERPDEKTIQEQRQSVREESISVFRRDALVQSEYGTFDLDEITRGGKAYFLCCQGLKQNEILKMVCRVAIDVGEGNGFVSLTLPWDAKEYMEHQLKEHSVSHTMEEEDLFVQFVITTDVLRDLAKSSPNPRDKDRRQDRTKPPMVIFVGSKPYKIIWHSRGRTVINKEYDIQFTGTGVKLARTSVYMWLTLAMGIGLVLFYGIFRGLSSDVSFEDLLQAALSIVALYVVFMHSKPRFALGKNT